MTNHVEEIRERCKTETNIEMRRESGTAKIDGVDEVVKLKEQEDEKNLTSGRNSGTESSQATSAGEGGTRDDTSSVSQLVQALHHGERTRRRLSQIDGRRTANSGSALGLHVHGRREGREDVGILGCERKGDESCAQNGGSEEDDG